MIHNWQQTNLDAFWSNDVNTGVHAGDISNGHAAVRRQVLP